MSDSLDAAMDALIVAARQDNHDYSAEYAAVRKAAREMGEEMTVETLYLRYSTEPGIAFGEDTEHYAPGDRVRVTKVEP